MRCRSKARTAFRWIGISYLVPVRESRTNKVPVDMMSDDLLRRRNQSWIYDDQDKLVRIACVWQKSPSPRNPSNMKNVAAPTQDLLGLKCTTGEKIERANRAHWYLIIIIFRIIIHSQPKSAVCHIHIHAHIHFVRSFRYKVSRINIDEVFTRACS